MNLQRLHELIVGDGGTSPNCCLQHHASSTQREYSVSHRLQLDSSGDPLHKKGMKPILRNNSKLYTTAVQGGVPHPPQHRRGEGEGPAGPDLRN
jgi:hypothetical protein